MKIQAIKADFEEWLNIGFIQTNLNETLAWFDPHSKTWTIPMMKTAELMMWEEIQKGFRDVIDYTCKPNIIVLPEVTLPLGYESSLERLCIASKSIVIAGLDFIKGKYGVQNKAVVMVPNKWPLLSKSKYVAKYYIGKTNFSKAEKSLFHGLGLNEYPDPAMYLFHAERYGNIGIAICSDFFDLERFVIYRGQIQHLIVISHNQDTDSYYFLSEAIARLVYCNVIICNTGFYGDSIAFSPYKETYDRYIYRHKGQGLFATQVVQLPVAELIKAQMDGNTSDKFKSHPPGYKSKFNDIDKV